MSMVIQVIGAICCGIVMLVAVVLHMNYLETNIWWLLILEPILIVITMSGCLMMSVRQKGTIVSFLAVGMFMLTLIATGTVMKQAFDCGKHITEARTTAINQWAVDAWNANVPTAMKVGKVSCCSYPDRVGAAAIVILRHYGNATIGYFELNLLLYAFLFPSIAFLFAVLWRRKLFDVANYATIVICTGTLPITWYLYTTIPRINF